MEGIENVDALKGDDEITPDEAPTSTEPGPSGQPVDEDVVEEPVVDRAENADGASEDVPADLVEDSVADGDAVPASEEEVSQEPGLEEDGA